MIDDQIEEIGRVLHTRVAVYDISQIMQEYFLMIIEHVCIQYAGYWLMFFVECLTNNKVSKIGTLKQQNGLMIGGTL